MQLNNPYWVKWVDSATAAGHEWRTHKEVEELKPPIVEIVGYIFKEEPDFLILVACRDFDPEEKDQSFWGEMTIPVGAILECRELKLGRIKRFNKKRKK